MGFRFRRSIKILPGIRLNRSKSGVSTSIGVPGATVNLGRRGTKAIVGLPGTGVSYSERLSGPPQAPPGQEKGRGVSWLGWIVFAMVVLMAVLAIRGA